jgi:hypothetical protein
MGAMSLDAILISTFVGGLVLLMMIGAIIWFGRSHRHQKHREQLTAKTQPMKSNRSTGEIMQEYGLQFIQESGKINTFTALPISLGRDAQNNLVLDDDTVSAQHARVDYDEIVGAIYIQDLDSDNGIYIDGYPTRKNILVDGARIRLGEVELRYRDTGYIHPGS